MIKIIFFIIVSFSILGLVVTNTIEQRETTSVPQEDVKSNSNDLSIEIIVVENNKDDIKYAYNLINKYGDDEISAANLAISIVSRYNKIVKRNQSINPQIRSIEDVEKRDYLAGLNASTIIAYEGMIEKFKNINFNNY